jgi:hypothetical protein
MRVRAGSGSTGTARAMRRRRGDFDGLSVLPLLGGGSDHGTRACPILKAAYLNAKEDLRLAIRRNLKLPADCSSSRSASWLWSIGLTRR